MQLSDPEDYEGGHFDYIEYQGVFDKLDTHDTLIDIGIGTIRRPIPKFWIKEFWIRDYAIKNPLTNPWNSGNHWFILNIPVMPYIFLGVFLGRWSKTNIIVKTLNKIFRTDDEDVREEYMPGFYIGGRTGYMREHGHQLAEFSPVDGSVVKWVTDEDGNPVGIETTLTTGNAGSGTLTIILKHEPTKPNDGTAAGAGGSTDVEVTFPITVQ